MEKEFDETHIDTSLNSEIPKQFIGNKTTYHSLIVQTIDSVFTVDMDTKLVSRRKRITINISSFEKNKKKKIGEDTFLNKKCDIIKLDEVKIWYWKGVALKKEFFLAKDQKIYEYATSIDENYIIKENEFKLPEVSKMK